MREAVICEPLRTPVGRLRRRVPRRAADRRSAATVIRELRARAPALPGRGRRRRDPRPVLPQRRGAGHRPRRRARRRAAGRGAGHAARPPLRLGAAGGHLRLPCRCRRGRATLVLAGGAESMSQAELYATGHALGRAGRRRHARGPARARPRDGRRHATTRCRAACSRPPRTCAASTAIPREEQDELALRSHQRAVAAQRGRRASPRRSCR